MIISCPRCQTRYDVPEASLGDGRVVRCSRCRHEWHAVPPAPEIVPEIVPVPAPVMEPEPEPVAAPPSAPAASNMDMAYGAEPASEEMPAAETEMSVVDIDAMFDSPAVAEETPAAASGPTAQIGDDYVPRRFKTAPVVPEEPKATPPGKKQILLLWLILGALIYGVVTLIFEKKALVLDYFPQARGFYEKLGDVFETPFDGLEIIDVTSTNALEGGSRVLVVQGRVANRAYQEKQVPPLRAALVDQKGLHIVEWAINVEQSALKPQESTSFREVLIDPDKDAVRVVVTFEGLKPGDAATGADAAKGDSAAKDHAAPHQVSSDHQAH